MVFLGAQSHPIASKAILIANPVTILKVLREARQSVSERANSDTAVFRLSRVFKSEYFDIL
jgi:hypothetical protein